MRRWDVVPLWRDPGSLLWARWGAMSRDRPKKRRPLVIIEPYFGDDQIDAPEQYKAFVRRLRQRRYEPRIERPLEFKALGPDIVDVVVKIGEGVAADVVVRALGAALRGRRKRGPREGQP